MESPHPFVVRVEKEHNYARPWHKKINAQQKYPNAFELRPDGTIDVGDSTQPFVCKQDIEDELIYRASSFDLPEQENKCDKDEVEVNHPEEPLLDTSTWTQQMDRLYFRTLQIFQEHYLSKLVHENLPNGQIRLVNLMENTSLQLRHCFGNIAGWDNELLTWLHNLFTSNLPMHDHLIQTYHEVLQYLCKKLPKLIEKFYPNPDRIPPSIATTPITSAATTPVHPSSGGGPASSIGQRSRHSSLSYHNHNALTLDEDPAARFVLEGSKPMPRRLTSNPIILLVPSSPSFPSQPNTPRMEYWKNLLSSMGQLINLNVPYRPDQTPAEVLQQIKTSVRDKIRDTMKKKFNELRPLLLVGFNHGSLMAIHCALENPGQVAAIICLGFPSSAINGFRGDLDDPMLDINVPTLFVVGQMASSTSIGALERLRDSMSRSDTGLIVVGGANDKLVVNHKKKMKDSITQYHVDRSIASEIYEFVNSINMLPPDGFI